MKKKLLNHKAEVFVIILLFAAKFLGFIKNIFMAKYYGTSIISDAYQMALSIPMIVLGIILYSYQAFTKGYFISEKNRKTTQYISSFINFILILLFFMAIFLFLFPDEIIKIFAPGFNNEQFMYTVKFIKPIILGTIFLAISNILAEYLRCKNSYVIAQFAYLIINIIEIVSIIIAYRFNYMWLSYGYFIANIIYFFILVIVCKNRKINYSCVILEKQEVKVFIKILIPIFVSGIISDINSMIDKIFASKFGTGIVATLGYSTNIKTVFLIIAAGYLTVLFPKIAKKFVEKDYVNYHKNIKESLLIILMVYIPLTVLVIIFSKTIVSLVYYRGAFDAESLIRTSNCLVMYTIGIAGISIRDLYMKALYCMEKGRLIVLISMI